MNTGEFAGIRGAGEERLRATRPVSGPPGNDTRQVTGAAGGVIASETSLRAWEGAYRYYGRAWEWTARSPKGDPAAAREMASASWAVAAAWRQIAAATTLPWWILAALESAAAAFESQARDWETRAKNEKP